MLLRTSILVLVVVIVKESFAEDRPREYREGAYCKDVSYVDTATEGVEGTFACQAGASTGICIRHAECIKKDGHVEEKSGCQSLYIRDALDNNKGIYDQVSCELYCTEIRPDLPVVSYRRSNDNKICCACSSRGFPGQYCHHEVKCVVGASFCCEGSGAVRNSFHLASTLTLTLLISIFISQ